jgi:hypothetical protein
LEARVVAVVVGVGFSAIRDADDSAAENILGRCIVF